MVKPVAWISKHSLKDIEQTWELTSLSPTKDDYFDTPLYTAPRELSDVFILEHHMGYVSPDGGFYAPDYKTWKEDGFTPVYKEPVLPRELSDELPSPVLQEYFEKGYRCAMESLQLNDDEILSLWHDWGQMMTLDQQRLSFARAILKKASEK